MSSQKLVVGIDYGTSNSGVAYALFEDGADDVYKFVKVIKRWPHFSLRRDGSEKVPSQIAYDEAGQPIGYGFEIPEGAHPLHWIKLLLDPDRFSGPQKTPNTERVWRTYDELEKLGKKPVDVITDYLRWLWAQTKKAVIEKEEEPSIFEDADVTVVLTLPASWPDRAKDCMVQAAHRAGIAQGARLKFRAEPEAAAVLELRERARSGKVKPGDCVIIVDAGGGTVDTSAYQIRQKEPLSVDQVVVSKGDFCGSAFVDAEFDCQLRSILGPDFATLSTEALAQVRDEFEYKIKRTYNPEEPKSYSIAVPGVADDATRNIKDGKLKLDDAAISSSFDTVMTQIMTLIDWQRDELRSKNLESKLKGILLVGGFGGSEYLHTRIRQEYPADEGIRVWRGDDSWTAVVQGAVACEASHRTNHCTVNTRLSSFNYGIPYRKGDARKVQWLVRKGQAIQSHTLTEPFGLRLEDVPFLDTDPYVRIVVSLVKTEDDNASDELDVSARPHVEITCRIPTDIRDKPETMLVQESPKAWHIPAELVLGMDGPILSVRCRIQGKDVGSADLKYYDDTEEIRSRRHSSVSSLSLTHRPSVEQRDSVISDINALSPHPTAHSRSGSGLTSPGSISPAALTPASTASSSKPVAMSPESRRPSDPARKPYKPPKWASRSAWSSVQTKRDKPPKEDKKKEKVPTIPQERNGKVLGTDGRYHKKPPDYAEGAGVF